VIEILMHSNMQLWSRNH